MWLLKQRFLQSEGKAVCGVAVRAPPACPCVPGAVRHRGGRGPDRKAGPRVTLTQWPVQASGAMAGEYRAGLTRLQATGNSSVPQSRAVDPRGGGAMRQPGPDTLGDGADSCVGEAPAPWGLPARARHGLVQRLPSTGQLVPWALHTWPPAPARAHQPGRDQPTRTHSLRLRSYPVLQSPWGPFPPGQRTAEGAYWLCAAFFAWVLGFCLRSVTCPH